MGDGYIIMQCGNPRQQAKAPAYLITVVIGLCAISSLPSFTNGGQGVKSSMMTILSRMLI